MGQPMTQGVIKKNIFSTSWGFIVSNVFHSLGEKSGSLDQVNELEKQILSAFIIGRNIDFE